MRILIAAFACRPDHGSEPGVGWAISAAAARVGHDVVLVTQRRNRTIIEAERRLDPDLGTNLHPHYIGLPATVMETWDRRAKLRGLQVYYLAWQVSLWRVARRIHRRAPLELAHHVTLSTDWVPSGLAYIDQLPLVWGPVGGGERIPPPCRTHLGRRGRLVEWTRRITVDPLRVIAIRAAARRCRLLIAQNREEARRFEGLGTPVTVRPNVFLGPSAADEPPPPPTAAAGGPGAPKAVFAGRLVAWKGVHLALATLRRPELDGWELHFYGDGPERRSLRRDIARFGLSDRVVLHGHRPRHELLSALAQADVFLYPSMREAAGWVVGEALSVGCPVVCLNLGGPPLLLEGLGTAVDPGPQMVGELSRAVAAARTMPRRAVRWDEAKIPDLLDQWYGDVGAMSLADPIR